MIKARGTYQISTDNGDTWATQENLLLMGYFNSKLDQNITLVLGENSHEPSYTETSMLSRANSNSKSGLGVSPNFKVSEDYIVISKSQDFSFGTGHNFTLRDIGLICSGDLFSRALMRDSNGPYGVTIMETDSVLARYTLDYTLPRAAILASINYKGEEIPATINFVNPSKWGGIGIGYPAKITSAGVGGGWVIGEDVSVTGPIVLSSIGVDIHKSSINDIKSYIVSFISSVDELIGTFDQIILCNGNAGPSNALVLIQLSKEITKTNKDTLKLSLALNQVPEL